MLNLNDALRVGTKSGLTDGAFVNLKLSALAYQLTFLL